MKNKYFEIVTIKGVKYTAFVNQTTGKPGIVLLGEGYDTGIACPPIPAGACPIGQDASCGATGTVWCGAGEPT